VLIQQIVRKARQANKAVAPLVKFFHAILDNLSNATESDEVLIMLSKSSDFSYLNLDDLHQEV